MKSAIALNLFNTISAPDLVGADSLHLPLQKGATASNAGRLLRFQQPMRRPANAPLEQIATDATNAKLETLRALLEFPSEKSFSFSLSDESMSFSFQLFSFPLEDFLPTMPDLDVDYVGGDDVGDGGTNGETDNTPPKDEFGFSLPPEDMSFSFPVDHSFSFSFSFPFDEFMPIMPDLGVDQEDNVGGNVGGRVGGGTSSGTEKRVTPSDTEAKAAITAVNKSAGSPKKLSIGALIAVICSIAVALMVAAFVTTDQTKKRAHPPVDSFSLQSSEGVSEAWHRVENS